MVEDHMTTLYMTKGLPASGKTSWAKAFIHQHKAGEVVRINKDDMRAMLHDSRFDRDRTEKLVVSIRDVLITEALGNKFVKYVIVDDTNFAPKHEQRLRQIAHEMKADFMVQDFTDVPVAECIKRDLKRSNSVGHKVINRMNMQYIQPKYEPPKYDPDLPNAVIVDLDGTLAHMNGRSPYDYSEAVMNDILDETVAGILRQVKDQCQVLYVSGRKSVCFENTLCWLSQPEHNLPAGKLHMREADDDRADTIVKAEIYEREIKGKFNVRFVLDDRDSVVAMWRQHGLKVLQCADGDF
jgi:predicted kinase